jgi:FkbM family methyltransferase
MSLHFLLTKLVIHLGPGNPLVGFSIRRRCRRHGVVLAMRDETLELRKGKRVMRLSRQHFIYAPDMAQRFDTYFLPLVPSEKDGVSTLDYSVPRLQTYRKSGLQFELASFPEEDDAIEGYFRWYRPQLGDTIFDVGAHCGVSTYNFSKLVGPTGRVIAFEPDPLNHLLLLRNIERHSLNNVTPLKIAIAGSRGRAAFHCEGTIGSGLARHSSRAAAGWVEMVETITLADAFERWGTPQLCKIDIEGAEVEVVSGASELLRRCRTQFALDTNHYVNGALTNSLIEKLFAKSDYEVQSLKVGGMMTTWARPGLDAVIQ